MGLVLSFLVQSCDLINPDEPIPVYIDCDSISFSVSNATQGSASADITDAWVYVDDNYLGTYELPAHFPVIAEGSHKISIHPGILVNGIKETRGDYQYYTSYDTVLNCEPGSTYLIKPHSTYRSGTTFMLMEDFEQSGLVFDRAPNSDTSLNVINDANAFENHSGTFSIDVNHPYFNYSSFPFGVPAGSTVYAELNYKGDGEFTVGVLALTSSGTVAEELLTIRPSSSWNKIYVNLSDAIKAQPLASGFRFLITSTLVSPNTTATVYLDNIKVVR
jgi:hypothetical protein